MPLVLDPVTPETEGRAVVDREHIRGEILLSSSYDESTNTFTVRGIDSTGNVYTVSLVAESQRTGAEIASLIDSALGHTGWRKSGVTLAETAAQYDLVENGLYILEVEAEWDAVTTSFTEPDRGEFEFPDVPILWVDWNVRVGLPVESSLVFQPVPTITGDTLEGDRAGRNTISGTSKKADYTEGLTSYSSQSNLESSSSDSDSFDYDIFWRMDEDDSRKLKAKMNGSRISTWLRRQSGSGTVVEELDYERLYLSMRVVWVKK